MSSNLRVNNILPSVGTNVAIGTAGGSITLTGTVSGSSNINVGTGASVSSPVTNVLTLGTNSVERVRIDSSGRLGIGLTNPQTTLQVNGQIIGQVGSGSGILYTTYGALSSSQVLNLNNNLLGYNLRGYVSSIDGGASTDNFYAMNTASYGFSGIEQAFGGAINFYTCNTTNQSTTANATVTPRLAAVVNPGGDFTISNGNLVMGTSGKGIDFSATANSSGTMTSELLSDYEEGTWTPSITGHTLSASSSGKYTKIGRTVHFWAQIIFGGSGAATATVNGLPFTVTGDGWSGYVAIQDTGFTTPIHTFTHGGTVQIYIRNTSNTDYNTNVFYNKFLYIQGAYNV